MRAVRIAAALIVCVLSLSFFCNAADIEEELYNSLKIQNVVKATPRAASTLVRGIDARGGRDYSGFISGLADILHNSLSDALGIAVKLFCVSCICAVALSFSDSRIRGVEIAGFASVTALTLSSITELSGVGKNAISELAVFSKALLPAMTAAVASTGAAGTAAQRATVSMLLSDVVLETMKNVLTPSVCAYACLLCAAAVCQNALLSKIAAALKCVIVWTVRALLTAFTAYVTISGVIAGTADAAAAKTIKFAVSGAVPIVGGILADASAAVFAGACNVKNSLGLYGIFAVLALFASPFFKTAAVFLGFKLAGALSSFSEEISSLIDSLTGAFSIILAMTASSALLVMISLLSGIFASGIM